MPLKGERRRSIPAFTDEQSAEVALASTPAVQVDLVFDYGQIAESVRREVEEGARFIKQRMQRVRHDLIAVGDRLVGIKQVLPHGLFSQWVLTEFHLSQRMAQNMMNVAERFGTKNETVSLFSDSALYLLAAPSTPDSAIAVATRLAQQRGHSPSRRELKSLIDAHKTPALEKQIDLLDEILSSDDQATDPTPAPDETEIWHVQGAIASQEQIEALHQWLGQWQTQVETYVAVTGNGRVQKALERLMEIMFAELQAADQTVNGL